MPNDAELGINKMPNFPGQAENWTRLCCEEGVQVGGGFAVVMSMFDYVKARLGGGVNMTSCSPCCGLYAANQLPSIIAIDTAAGLRLAGVTSVHDRLPRGIIVTCCSICCEHHSCRYGCFQAGSCAQQPETSKASFNLQNWHK